MSTLEEQARRAAERMQQRTFLNHVRALADGDPTYTKAAVAGATSSDATWAGPLAENLPGSREFYALIERAAVLLAAGFLRVPFNLRAPVQTTKPAGYRVTEGEQRPVTSLGFSTLRLEPASVGSIVVMSRELLRSTAPGATSSISRQLSSAVISAANTALLDPAVTGSILDGASPIASSGTDADGLLADLAQLLEVGDAPVIIASLPWATRIQAALRGAAPLFPLLVAPEAGDLVIGVDRGAVAVAWGEVSIALSEAAALQMLDNPSAGAQNLVSMFQTNMVALRAELAANWEVVRAGGIAYADYSAVSP